MTKFISHKSKHYSTLHKFLQAIHMHFSGIKRKEKPADSWDPRVSGSKTEDGAAGGEPCRRRGLPADQAHRWPRHDEIYRSRGEGQAVGAPNYLSDDGDGTASAVHGELAVVRVGMLQQGQSRVAQAPANTSKGLRREDLFTPTLDELDREQSGRRRRASRWQDRCCRTHKPQLLDSSYEQLLLATATLEHEEKRAKS
jgi:hypothetical protein